MKSKIINKTTLMRKRTKQRIIDAFGGKCGICGYDKCNSALDVHHLDPLTKEFAIGQVKASNRNWNSLVSELRKCILVCCRCHREIHDNILEIPNNITKFNEEYSDYKNILLKDEKDLCPVCGNKKSIYNMFCSSKCSGSKSWTIKWDEIDLLALMLKYETYSAVGRVLGVNGNIIKRMASKLGIIDKLNGKYKFICKRCGKEFTGNIADKRKYCSYQCARLENRKVIRPNKDVLEKLIIEKPMTQIGKMFGVSDNAVRKWIKYYGIII